MCGIAGILERRGAPADPGLAKRMSDRMIHRGPDDEGLFHDGCVALSHRRLAILDLSDAAHQPMTAGGLTLVYNGELYNFRDLRRELEAVGHRFASTGDTEVVLAAFAVWGPRCVERFDGMFAFAVWDHDARRLFLARDRFGIKPLYWRDDGTRFTFASEIKPLLEAGAPREADAQALAEYFTFQNIFTDRTLFAGVSLLPPGHRMLVGPEVSPVVERWWQPELDAREGRDEAAWADDVRDVLGASVRRQLVADVPVGSYLSGGMDSASLVALASQDLTHLSTFTGGFDLTSVSGFEAGFDERDAAHYGTEAHEVVLRAGDLARIFPRLVWHLEDLRVGSSWQNWYAAGLAASSVEVVLAGTGGDEIFAGYPWRYDEVAGAADFEDASYALWTRLLDASERRRFFSDDLNRRVGDHDPRAVFAATVADTAGADPVSRELVLEMQTFLHGLLVVQDRIAMAHSLEERVPFLDHELVDLAARIPSRLKHRPGSGKLILREAMRGILPEEVVTAPKQGFSVPEGSWYRGPSVDYVHGVLLEPRCLDRGYFRPEEVRRVVAEHVEGRRNHRLLIWSLLSFEWWNRLFLDGEDPA